MFFLYVLLICKRLVVVWLFVSLLGLLKQNYYLITELSWKATAGAFGVRQANSWPK